MRWCLAPFMIAGIIWGTAVSGQEVDYPPIPPRDEAEEQMRAWHETRRAHSTARALSAARYSLAGNDRAEVLLISTMPNPTPISLDVYSPDGERYPLGQYQVDPTTHLFLDLADLVASHGGVAPSVGSLRIAFVGDARTLSGWLIQHRGQQVVEVPLQDSSVSETRGWRGFMDLRLMRHELAAPVYVLANHGPTPLPYKLTLGRGAESLRTTVGILPPGGQETFSQPKGSLPSRWTRGWLYLEYEGPPGAAVATGFLLGEDFLAGLPLVPDDEPPATAYQAISLPSDLKPPTATYVTLHPPHRDAEVSLELLNERGERTAASRRVRIEGDDARSIRLESFFPNDHRGSTLRLRVDSTAPIYVSGFQRSAPKGEIVDLAFFREADGHSTGSYPLPDLPRHDVVTRFVNLAAEQAQIVGQVYWPDGAYSFGPIPLAGWNSIDLSIKDLIKASEPDLVGRKLPGVLQGGLLRWTTVGAASIIARTVARRGENQDSFGFNCKSCCENIPYGAIEPGLVELLPGESVLFQSCYYYSTCDGQMGPFPIAPAIKNVPSPFSWDGSTITASSAADADITFEVEVQGNNLLCGLFWRWIWGKGRAEACKKLHLGPYSATESCSSQTNICSLCNGCCWAQYNYKVCTGKDPHIRESERNSCLGHCATDRCS